MRPLLLCLAALTLHAAGPGEIVLNVEPSPGFPRNSEGAFATLKDGSLIFIHTQFYGGASDHSAARLVARTSMDDGRTWSAEPRTILENEGGANVMSVSLLRLQDGRLALFYLLKNSWMDCRPHVRFSSDEAATWSAPVRMTQAPGYFVLNNDRVIQMRSGRLVAPVAFHRARGEDPDSSKSFDGRAIALWLVSDDAGASWSEAPQWLTLPAPATRTGLQEPGVVELANGSLFSWFRTDQVAQFESRSTDQGRTWSAPVPGPMRSPASPASLKLLPNGVLFGVWNDHGGGFDFVAGKRTPLVAALSRDGGRTWPVKHLLEDDPDGWYCYTAIHVHGDAVLLAYCAGDSKVGGLNRLRIRRLPLSGLH
jgi:sialidase-1